MVTEKETFKVDFLKEHKSIFQNSNFQFNPLNRNGILSKRSPIAKNYVDNLPLIRNAKFNNFTEEDEPFAKFNFLSWGNWIFISLLQDEKDDALTWGHELVSTLDIGKISIKNISYFEIAEYPRTIPGQPVGNNPIPDTLAADGINDLISGFWFSKRGHHESKHHFAPGIGLQFPTASSPTLGSEKWSIGPSFDYEFENEKLIAGAIFIQLWSFAGASDRKDVNMLLVKPFLYYNFAKNWDLMYIPYGVTVYWNKAPGQKVYLPLGGGIRRSFPLKSFDLNISAQFFHNVIRPDKGAVNDLRFLVELAF